MANGKEGYRRLISYLATLGCVSGLELSGHPISGNAQMFLTAAFLGYATNDAFVKIKGKNNGSVTAGGNDSGPTSDSGGNPPTNGG